MADMAPRSEGFRAETFLNQAPIHTDHDGESRGRSDYGSDKLFRAPDCTKQKDVAKLLISNELREAGKNPRKILLTN